MSGSINNVKRIMISQIYSKYCVASTGLHSQTWCFNADYSR